LDNYLVIVNTDAIITFIKDFRPSNFNLGLGECLIIFGLLVLGAILGNRIISILPPNLAAPIRTITRIIFKLAFYSFILLILLNAILTGEYGNIFVIGIMYAASKIDYWYKLYDDFVDRKIKK